MNKILLLFVVSLLLISFSSAASPFVVQTGQGIIIEPELVDFLKLNQNFTFSIHVFNQSNGLPITNATTCYADLYDAYGLHSYHSENSTVPVGDFDYIFFVPSNNFTRIGEYNMKFQCNNSVRGGAAELEFVVNQLGLAFSTGQALIYIIFILIMLLIFIGLMVAGIALPSKNNTDAMTGYIIAISNMKYVKIFCLIFAYLAWLVILFTSWMLSLSYLDFVFLSTLFQWIFYIFAAFSTIYFIACIYFLITNWVRDNKLSDFLSRGLKTRG